MRSIRLSHGALPPVMGLLLNNNNNKEGKERYAVRPVAQQLLGWPTICKGGGQATDTLTQCEMAHTSTQLDTESEVPTPQDFSYTSVDTITNEEAPGCSHPPDDITTAEEASDLIQALEASKEDDIKRQSYESIKAREDEYKRRGIAWNMNQARLNPRTGPLGATGKGARVKKQPER